MTQTQNKIAEMFNIDEVKKQIKNCPKDEVVILCGHWSINQPKYDGQDAETYSWEFDEMEQIIGLPLMVNDYDDLICDVHGIMNY